MQIQLPPMPPIHVQLVTPKPVWYSEWSFWLTLATLLVLIWYTFETWRLRRINDSALELHRDSMRHQAVETKRSLEIASETANAAQQSAEMASQGLTILATQAAALESPAIWASIIDFRDTSPGVNFRAAIMKYLETNAGAEIAASIDASLRANLPPHVLEEARVAMSALLTARGNTGLIPAIWSDAARLWDGQAIWRKKTRLKFEDYVKEQKLGPYDPCPCGSYENVKFCCRNALQD